MSAKNIFITLEILSSKPTDILVFPFKHVAYSNTNNRVMIGQIRCSYYAVETSFELRNSLQIYLYILRFSYLGYYRQFTTQIPESHLSDTHSVNPYHTIRFSKAEKR